MTTLIVIAIALLTVTVLLPLLIRTVYRAPKVEAQSTPDELGLPHREMRIPTANGKQLFAWFIPLPDGAESGPAVAVMHGWGGNAGHMLPFASLLHDQGYAVLLLDARNHGQSDSDGHSSMPRFAEDLEHGLEWMKQQPGIDPHALFLLGHSVGAAATLLLASRRQDLSGVVSIAAFAHPAELMRRQMRSHHIPYMPVGWLLLRYVQRVIKARFDDIAPCNTIRQIACPVLLVHGERDKVVPSADAQKIYANRLDDRVELLLLPKAGHDSRRAITRHGQELIAFLQQTMDNSQKSPGKT